MYSFRIRCPHRTYKGSIFSITFSKTAHTRISCHIQNRCQYMGNATGRFLSAHNFCNLFFQLGIKACSPANPRRKTGGILNEGPAQSFHKKIGTVFHHNLLHFSLPCSHFIKCLHPAHFQRAYFSHSVFCLLLNFFKVIGILIKRKNTVNLCHLFVKAHFFEQKRGSFFCTQCMIPI